MVNLLNRKDAIVNKSFATYLAHDWNDRHMGPQRVKHIRIHFMQETTPPPPGGPMRVTPSVFYEFQCPKDFYERIDEAYIP